MPYPPGVATKTISFGRYSNVLGSVKGGSVTVGFEKPMLHVPSGEVIVGGDDTMTVDSETGSLNLPVPVTVTPDLVAGWDTASPFVNQRLKIKVNIPGYPDGTRYMDIHPDDPMVMDYDMLTPYSVPGGLSVVRAAVTSVGGESGDISDAALRAILDRIGAGPGITPLVATLPPATEAYRGRTVVLMGAVGSADVLHICLKAASGLYTWSPV